MIRLLAVLITVLSAIAAAVLTWPIFFRLERTFPLVQIVSFRGLLVVAFAAACVLALLFALARPIRGFALSLALIAGVAAIANGGIMLSRGLGGDTLPAATDTSLRVMTWNTAGSATPAEAVAKTAVAMDADIVALPETTVENGEAIAIAMREMGRPMWVHHTDYDGWAAQSTTMLISPELGDYSVIESSSDGSSNTRVVPSVVAMPVDGDGPIVVAAHAVAPRASDMDDWQADLQWLADQCVEANVIMAGDFNATLDHMAGLGVDGSAMGKCDDAAAHTGNGAVGTWSSAYPALAGAPIDHVMYGSHWRPTGSVVLRSMDDSGSDHRPVVVQLEPAS